MGYEKNQNDAGMQFNYKEIQEGLYVCRLRLALAAPYKQEINVQVEVTRQKLRTIAHYIMVHTGVSDKYL